MPIYTDEDPKTCVLPVATEASVTTDNEQCMKGERDLIACRQQRRGKRDLYSKCN